MPDPTALLVTFARPEESRAFRRRLRPAKLLPIVKPAVAQGWIGSARVVVAHTGIGSASARSAIQALLADRAWTMVIGAGFAGGLDPRLALGDTLLEEFPAKSPRRIVSRALPIETVAAKRALRAETGALAVDMETETLAAECQAADLPFVALRVISDHAEIDLPIPFACWFDLARQRPRPLRLLAHLARHPSMVMRFCRFIRAIPELSAALAIAVEGCIGSAERI